MKQSTQINNSGILTHLAPYTPVVYSLWCDEANHWVCTTRYCYKSKDLIFVTKSIPNLTLNSLADVFLFLDQLSILPLPTSLALWDEHY